MNAITEQINLSTDLDMSNYWMPFTANRQFKAAPRLLKSAKGMYYTTVDNRQIIDGCAGLWCVNAGHGRTEIIEAVHKQMTEMDFAPSFQMAHPIAFAAAPRVAEVMVIRGKFYVVREREKYEDLVKGENIPKELK